MKFLRLKQIIGTKENPGKVPVSASSWWAGCKSGKYPKPLKIGKRTTVWIEEEIDALAKREVRP